MDSHPQVDLGHLLDAEALGHVDQECELHAVTGGQPRLVQHRPGRGGLPGEGLANRRQVGEQQVQGGAGHELGDAPTFVPLSVQGPLVEPLHQGHVRLPGSEVLEQGAQQAGDEMGAEVLHVGVEEDEELGVGLFQRHRHGLALSSPQGARRDDARPAAAGHRGGVVAGPVVDHDDVVHQVDAASRPGEGVADARHDGAHGAGLVARREAHRHPAPAARRHQGRDLEVTVVEVTHHPWGGRAGPESHAPIISHPGPRHATTPVH